MGDLFLSKWIVHAPQPNEPLSLFEYAYSIEGRTQEAYVFPDTLIVEAIKVARAEWWRLRQLSEGGHYALPTVPIANTTKETDDGFLALATDDSFAVHKTAFGLIKVT